MDESIELDAFWGMRNAIYVAYDTAIVTGSQRKKYLFWGEKLGQIFRQQ